MVKFSKFIVWLDQQYERQDEIGTLVRHLWSLPERATFRSFYWARSYCERPDLQPSLLQAFSHATAEFEAIRTSQRTALKARRRPPIKRVVAPLAKPVRLLQVTPGYLALRFAILQRDKYRCRICGVSAHDGDHVRLEVDHITPRIKGGTDDPSNLWTLCFSCNRGKGTSAL